MRNEHRRESKSPRTREERGGGDKTGEDDPCEARAASVCIIHSGAGETQAKHLFSP